MSAFKDIYDVIKDLVKLTKDADNQEMASKVVEIQEKFFDLREEMEEIKEENRNLKDTIARMHDDEELEKDLELTEYGFYIMRSEKEEGKNNYYCAACWLNHHKLMPLIKLPSSTRPKCCNCEAVYRV